MRWAASIVFSLITSLSFADDNSSLLSVAEEMRASWKAPGMVLVVVRGDQTLVLSGLGYRDRENQKPVTENTIFPIGSCTKAFTSAAVASLVTDQKMSFDDPVRKHLASFILSDPEANSKVTIRDLLSHRTGLNGNDLLWYRAPWSLGESIRRVEFLPLAGPFRNSFFYSSLTVAAAGRAAGNAAGQTWEELIRSRICQPLEMKTVAFSTKQFESFSDRAIGYQRTKKNDVEPMPAYDMKEPHPAGSIHLSGKELEKWLKYQLANRTAALAETKTPQIDVPMTDIVKPYHPHGTRVQYGMGWLIYDYRGKSIIAHGGMIDGFRTQITLLPDEKIGIAIVNNLHDSKLNLALTTAIIDQLLKLPASDWAKYYLDLEKKERDDLAQSLETLRNQRQANVKPSVPLDRFKGVFHNDAYGDGTLTFENGQLIWKWSSFRCPLEHWEGNVFRITEGLHENRLIEFRIDGRAVTALRFCEQIFVRKP